MFKKYILNINIRLELQAENRKHIVFDLCIKGNTIMCVLKRFDFKETWLLKEIRTDLVYDVCMYDVLCFYAGKVRRLGK